ncbi:centromere protein Q [Ambystoma mexicanum]|uniref:centromere protein Q n=1 Tax=Ambystoma mexicanum TaxID=8296 RepID=UPI0037E84A30
MVPRVKAAAANENKSIKAKKKDGAATSSSAMGKPQKPVAKLAKCPPFPNENATSQEELSDQKSKTGNKRRRAEADPDQEVVRPSTKKQKKCSPAARKVCTRDKDGKTVPLPSAKTAKWKCISRESLDYLTTIIDGSIMTLLSKKVPDREAVQTHLRNLKGRLLAHCQHLKVPPEVSGQYKRMYTKLELEKEQLQFHQEALGELQDEVDKSVKTLEQMAEEIEILQGKIHILKSQQDEDSLEVSSSPGNRISLDLPKASLEAPLLQDEVLKIPNHKALLQDLDTARSLTAMQDMQALVEEAFAEVDAL